MNSSRSISDTLHFTTGCDSVWRTVNLTIQGITSVTSTQLFAQDKLIHCHGELLSSTAGVYRDTLHFTTGCDSLRRTVNLTVQSTGTSINQSGHLCRTNLYVTMGSDSEYSRNLSGYLRYTTGCDSVRRTVNLTVQSSSLQ